MGNNKYDLNLIIDSNSVTYSDYLFENDSKVLGYDADSKDSNSSIKKGECIKIDEGRVCLNSFSSGSGMEQVKEGSPIFELFGILIDLAFEAPQTDLYTNWIQTVITNFDQKDLKNVYNDGDIKLKNTQFIDGDDISSMYKFFYAKNYVDGIDVKEFSDNPQRRKLKNKTVIWDAELSLIQFDSKRFHRLISFKYGFTLIYNKPLIERKIEILKSPSVFHINAVKTIPILEFLKK